MKFLVSTGAKPTCKCYRKVQMLCFHQPSTRSLYCQQFTERPGSTVSLSRQTENVPLYMNRVISRVSLRKEKAFGHLFHISMQRSFLVFPGVESFFRNPSLNQSKCQQQPWRNLFYPRLTWISWLLLIICSCYQWKFNANVTFFGNRYVAYSNFTALHKFWPILDCHCFKASKVVDGFFNGFTTTFPFKPPDVPTNLFKLCWEICLNLRGQIRLKLWKRAAKTVQASWLSGTLILADWTISNYLLPVGDVSTPTRCRLYWRLFSVLGRGEPFAFFLHRDVTRVTQDHLHRTIHIVLHHYI